MDALPPKYLWLLWSETEKESLSGVAEEHLIDYLTLVKSVPTSCHQWISVTGPRRDATGGSIRTEKYDALWGTRNRRKPDSKRTLYEGGV